MTTQESVPENFNIEVEDVKRRESLFYLVERNVLDPELARLITDPVETAMFINLLPELLEGGRLQSTLEWAYAFRRQRGSHYPQGYDLRTLEFGLDKQFRREFSNDYPHFATGRHFWRGGKVFDHIDHDELLWDMQENLRSTDVDSYQPEKILSNLLKDRWHRPPVVADAGMGFGVGLKKWSMYEEYPYVPIQALRAPRRGPIWPELAPDDEVQAKIDYLTNQKPVIDRVIGYDILPIASENDDRVKLGFSSTFPMSRSILDPEGVAEFYSLLKESPPGVELLTRELIDAADPADLAHLSRFLPDGKADIFTFSGILLQLPPEKLAGFFYNFLPYCNKGAVFIAKEWANLDPKLPGGLRMIRKDWWHRGRFKLFIIDPFNLERAPLEFCSFLNRQCEQMYLTPEGRRLLLE